jgi:hypothetical protein
VKFINKKLTNLHKQHKEDVIGCEKAENACEISEIIEEWVVK